MTEVALLCRLILAVVLVISAVAKLRDRAGSRRAVQEFGIPSALVPLVAGVLPFVELACALLLVTADPGATLGAVASLALLGAFTVTIGVNLLRGKQVDCHCFGQLSGGPTGWRSVARNALLMLLAALPLARSGDLASLPAAVDDYTAAEVGVVTALLLLTTAVVVLGVLFRTLMARYGGVLLRLEALETLTGLATPQPAPDFALPDLEGEVLRLEDVLQADKPAMVVFIAPTCHLCSELLPDLEAWQSDEDHPLSIVVVSSGSVADNRTKIGADSPLRVLLQTDRETDLAYGHEGTPAAFLINPDGTFAAPAVHGVDPIRAAHANVVANLTGGGHDHGLHQIQPRPVTPGDVLPELTLKTDEGEPVTLAALTRDEQVLLFWRFDCGYCAQIVGDVVAREGDVPLVVVTTSTTETIRQSGITSRLIREDAGELTTALQVPGTPSAVTVRDGVVTSAVAVGGPDVLALLDRNRARADVGA